MWSSPEYNIHLLGRVPNSHLSGEYTLEIIRWLLGTWLLGLDLNTNLLPQLLPSVVEDGNFLSKNRPSRRNMLRDFTIIWQVPLAQNEPSPLGAPSFIKIKPGQTKQIFKAEEYICIVFWRICPNLHTKPMRLFVKDPVAIKSYKETDVR